MSRDENDDFGLSGLEPRALQRQQRQPATESVDGDRVAGFPSTDPAATEDFGLLGAAPPGLGLPGIDVDDILGALGGNGPHSTAFQKAIAARLASRRPIVQKVIPTKARNWMMGFGPVEIQPGQIQNIQSQPRCLYRIERLITTLDAADLSATDDLFVLNMFIGQKPQFPGPIKMRDLMSPFFDRSFDTCDPALSVTFQVENRGSKPHMWSLSTVGKAIQ